MAVFISSFSFLSPPIPFDLFEVGAHYVGQAGLNSQSSPRDGSREPPHLLLIDYHLLLGRANQAQELNKVSQSRRAHKWHSRGLNPLPFVLALNRSLSLSF